MKYIGCRQKPTISKKCYVASCNGNYVIDPKIKVFLLNKIKERSG